MRQSMSSLLSASAIVAILVLHSVDASTSVEATCKAAAESDKHVINEFCVQELSKHPDSPRADAWGLAKCQVLYTDVDYSFNRTRDEINLRNYAEGKEAVGIATELVQRCEGRFAKAKIQSTIAAHSWYSEQIATTCTAITNLVK
ncbi:hypothetical protein C2845_PMPSC021342 [Panicum miliaceum]|uniref:Pectinesterase inhibitor domain-containing protein n=1 Tax=Panicum miliaceum TaxID=4540 RepID=A0A3L6PAM8_PANMI|nr:hypothetical protein C2845_PMPSC021342 [Panicum miliaceum]